MASDDKSPKPGEAALQNMKLLKSETSVFKFPKVPKRKIHRNKVQVLDEEMYVEGIAKIIQRDFFPDLEKLKAQNEYLEASENKDYARLQEITRKYSGSRPPTEPYNTPATFDTPGSERPFTPSAPTVQTQTTQDDTESSTKEKTNDITDGHSLDSFLAGHTSEDNASYDRVIALEDKKKANKLASQFEAEVTSAIEADAVLMLPSIEQQADQSERPNEIQTWRYRARNHVMYVPDGGPQPAPPRARLAHRHTRLAAEPFDHTRDKLTIASIAREQESNISGKIGVDGVSITSGVSGAGAGGGAGATYPLLGTPSPRPGAGADRSPLMTWGEIEGTPFRLDGGDTPLPAAGAGCAYRMLEGGARERLALQLAERAARRRRLPSPAAHTPSPSFRTNTERLASMSPAARRLAAKHLASPRLKLTPHDLGVQHASPRTPRSPRPSASRPLASHPLASRRPSSRLPASPRLVNETQPVDDTLTDNLLQINLSKRSRLKAQDFFKT